MHDTSPAAEQRYYELLRQQSPMQRLNTAVMLTRTVRQLALADILRRNPAASPRQVQYALADRLYGEETARRLFTTSAG